MALQVLSKTDLMLHLQEVYQSFYSRRSLYLAVFRLTDGPSGVDELDPWLRNVQVSWLKDGEGRRTITTYILGPDESPSLYPFLQYPFFHLILFPPSSFSLLSSFPSCYLHPSYLLSPLSLSLSSSSTYRAHG